ncbi:uncharacterized protein BO96DRAFT_72012 [Aspergillus niger CBS 101883]|uniref:uncharacterized protein n=1 Tax=Aspergillus lacticoffeatus (strain CBS 101883) TaxID=1450533 RepID=UPI000D800778|nr:uncharacterized protein BO96DRAFT_72012 [Aspergillus niger CBS 101883]PYH55635.1 hypothetical protein BO96DRAFT_72012 [Aspergillus niger CBS 101883]
MPKIAFPSWQGLGGQKLGEADWHTACRSKPEWCIEIWDDVYRALVLNADKSRTNDSVNGITAIH